MFEMSIGGRQVGSLHRAEVRSPSTGEVVGLAPQCVRADVDDAMAAADAAFHTAWRDELAARRDAMHACASVLTAAAEEIGTLTTREQGMPLPAAIEMVHRAGRTFRRYADLEVPTTVVHDDRETHVEVFRRPLGVVAAIKPWNVPISMAVNAVAPAFRAGCTVVLKPSPFTPLGTLRMGELLQDVLDPGVLNVLSGADDVGQWMVEHPLARAVTFTGSVATGMKVNAAAAPDLKRVLLELGGNDAAIVLDDVRPAEIADRLFWSAFRNCGQICMAIKRVYVPESLHAEVVAAMVSRAGAVRMGDGMAAGTQMGPINNAAQHARIVGLVDDARAAGATVRSGGQDVPDEGYFFAPTIVTDVSDHMEIVAEEQFGPVLPVLSYRTLDEAVERANATTYGLGASVWSSDPERARRVAERLEAGTVWVNTHGVIGPNQPFAGWKWSGIGAENGIHSIEAFSQTQVVHRQLEAPRDPEILV